MQNKDSLINPLLLETYGPNDLAEKPAFQGGYINFGFWKDIELRNTPITKEERILASRALYDLVINQFLFSAQDKVLEIGCGRGYGCAKITKTFKPALVAGVDATPEQIERAKALHFGQEYENLSLIFKHATASLLPFPDQSFSKLYSVEAAQCFPSIRAFSHEAWRVLENHGEMVITAHFATDEKSYHLLKDLIPTVGQGVDRLIPIDDVRRAFSAIGFKEVFFEAIGKHVFEGFHRWRLQVGDVKWADAVFQSYLDGYLEYYIIKLVK